MANYRNISTDFWTDPKVDDEFTPEDKYFYLYLLTNPHTNICGCYEVSKKQMERESGYNWETIQRLLSRLETYLGVIKYDSDTKEVLILHWGKYNWQRSDKVKIAIQSVARHIKSSAFKDYIENALSAYMDSKQITDNRKQKQIQITETDTDTDTVSDTDGYIGYRYPMHTISEPAVKAKKNAFHNFDERRYGKELDAVLVNC